MKALIGVLALLISFQSTAALGPACADLDLLGKYSMQDRLDGVDMVLSIEKEEAEKYFVRNQEINKNNNPTESKSEIRLWLTIIPYSDNF